MPSCEKARYDHVEVLLLRWEDDELQVEWELNDLAKVLGDYGFHTETWLIPTESPLRKMMSKAIEFVERHEAKDTLFIVRLLWRPRKDQSGPSINLVMVCIFLLSKSPRR